MIPEYWAVVDCIPKTSVGKFDKKTIKEQFGEGGLTVIVESRFGSGE
jgi:fatty-acyl-CoA synthase